MNITKPIIIFLFFLASCAPTPAPTPTPTLTPTKEMPSPSPTPTLELPIGKVIVQSLSVRSSPGRRHQQIGFFNQGGEFYIIAEALDEYTERWFLISVNNNQYGWINGEDRFVTKNYVMVNKDTYQEVYKLAQNAKNTLDIKQFSQFRWLVESSRTVPNIFLNTIPLTDTAILECKNTSNKVGQFVTCQIPRAYCEFLPTTNGDPTFCNDAPYPNNNFTLVVFGQDWSEFDGECIIISGTRSTYGGKPQIQTENRARVSYCP